MHILLQEAVVEIRMGPRCISRCQNIYANVKMEAHRRGIGKHIAKSCIDEGKSRIRDVQRKALDSGSLSLVDVDLHMILIHDADL